MVDARDDQIDPTVGQQVVERHLHTIDRSSREGVDLDSRLLVLLFQKEGLIHRNSLAHTALCHLGGNDNYPSELAGNLHRSPQTFGCVAVVVGDKYQFFAHHTCFIWQQRYNFSPHFCRFSFAFFLHACYICVNYFFFHEGVSLRGSQLGADRQTFRHHVFELQTTVGVRMV